MRLLLTVEYITLLFGKDVDYSKIIGAMEGICKVEKTGPYGQQVWEKIKDLDISVQLVSDNDIRLPDQTTNRPESLTKLLEVASERDKLQGEVHKLENALKKIRETIAPEAKE